MYRGGLFDGICFDMTPKEVTAFPPISFAMAMAGAGKDNKGTIELDLQPRFYLRTGTAFCDDEGYFGLGIDVGGNGEGTILGDTFMQPFTTIFDRANQRIGFIETPDGLCGLNS